MRTSIYTDLPLSVSRLKELILSNWPIDVLSDAEYAQLYHEVLATITSQESTAAAEVSPKVSTPGVTTASEETTADGGVSNGQPVASADGNDATAEVSPARSESTESTSEKAANPDGDVPDEVAEALQRLEEQEALAKVWKGS